MTEKLTTEDCKLLTERVLGECWHEFHRENCYYGKGLDCEVCVKCKLYRGGIIKNRTFTTDKDKGDVFRKLVDSGRWDLFRE